MAWMSASRSPVRLAAAAPTVAHRARLDSARHRWLVHQPTTGRRTRSGGRRIGSCPELADVAAGRRDFVRSPDQVARPVRGVSGWRPHSRRARCRVGRCVAGVAVAVGTMHLAKGLEFRAVAIVACDDEILPLQSRIERVADDADIEEVYSTERHLLYVACTRARDRLLVTGVEPAPRVPGRPRRRIVIARAELRAPQTRPSTRGGIPAAMDGTLAVPAWGTIAPRRRIRGDARVT